MPKASVESIRLEKTPCKSTWCRKPRRKLKDTRRATNLRRNNWSQDQRACTPRLWRRRPSHRHGHLPSDPPEGGGPRALRVFKMSVYAMNCGRPNHVVPLLRSHPQTRTDKKLELRNRCPSHQKYHRRTPAVRDRLMWRVNCSACDTENVRIIEALIFLAELRRRR